MSENNRSNQRGKSRPLPSKNNEEWKIGRSEEEPKIQKSMPKQSSPNLNNALKSGKDLNKDEKHPRHDKGHSEQVGGGRQGERSGREGMGRQAGAGSQSTK